MKNKIKISKFIKPIILFISLFIGFLQFPIKTHAFTYKVGLTASYDGNVITLSSGTDFAIYLSGNRNIGIDNFYISYSGEQNGWFQSRKIGPGITLPYASTSGPISGTIWSPTFTIPGTSDTRVLADRIDYSYSRQINNSSQRFSRISDMTIRIYNPRSYCDRKLEFFNIGYGYTGITSYGSLALPTNVPITHTWPPSWSQDASNHWADCTRCGGRIQTQGHYDNDGNGLCDVCGRDIQPPRIPRVTYVKDSTGFYAYSFVQDNSWVQATRWWVWNTADNNWRYFESAESGDWWVNGGNYNRRIRINIGNFSNSTGPYHVDCRAYDGNWLCSDQVANNSNLFLRVCSDVYIDNVPPILDRSTYKIDQNGVDCYVHAYDPPDRSSGLNHLNVCTWNSNIGDWTTGKTFDIANEGNWTIDGQNYNYYYRVNKTDFQNFNTGYCSAARIFDNSGSQREAWDGTGSVKQILSNVGLTTHLIFDANGGTVNGNLTYEADWVIGSSQTPPVPIKPGYNFVGWDGWTGIVPVAAATYKAVWTEHLLKVTLDLNKPETSILIPTCEKPFITGHYTFPYNKRETLPDPLLTDYVFDGWYSDPIAGDKIMPDTIVSKLVDHILYAHWIAKPPLLINTLNSQEVIEYTGLSDVDYLNQHGVINSTGTKTLPYPYSITHYKIISSGGIDASGNTNQFEWYTSKDQINWTKIHCPENGLYTYSDGVTARVECQKTKTGTTSELILSNVNRTYHHNFYKCVIINNAGSITSNTANLTVFWLPKI